MDAGRIYDPADPEILAEQTECAERLYEYNATRPSETERRAALLKEMLGAVGEDCWIEPPLRANWGGRHLFLGKKVYVNFNLCAVDDGNISIGDHTMLGPNVTLATANHPVEPSLRERGLQYNRDIRIGRNVWIGGHRRGQRGHPGHPGRRGGGGQSLPGAAPHRGERPGGLLPRGADRLGKSVSSSGKLQQFV